MVDPEMSGSLTSVHSLSTDNEAFGQVSSPESFMFQMSISTCALIGMRMHACMHACMRVHRHMKMRSEFHHGVGGLSGPGVGPREHYLISARVVITQGMTGPRLDISCILYITIETTLAPATSGPTKLFLRKPGS
jgi:hypothetical protein